MLCPICGNLLRHSFSFINYDGKPNNAYCNRCEHKFRVEEYRIYDTNNDTSYPYYVADEKVIFDCIKKRNIIGFELNTIYIELLTGNLRYIYSIIDKCNYYTCHKCGASMYTDSKELHCIYCRWEELRMI